MGFLLLYALQNARKVRQKCDKSHKTASSATVRASVLCALVVQNIHVYVPFVMWYNHLKKVIPCRLMKQRRNQMQPITVGRIISCSDRLKRMGQGFARLLRTLARASRGIVWIFCWMCARLVQRTCKKNKGAKDMATIIGVLLFGFWFFQALFKHSK